MSKLFLESAESIDEGIEVYVNKAGGVAITMNDTDSIDSYNVRREMVQFLSRAQAERLRNWLIDYFPLNDT